MDSFIHTALPGRVVFGRGTLAGLADELRLAGRRKLLVLSTPEQRGAAERIGGQLGSLAAGIFAGARMHTPVEVSEEAAALARNLGADGVVSVGGGSTIGLGKAIALRTDLFQAVVPTTYAGSEMTPLIGETADGVKKTQRNVRVLPELVVYDVDLTLSLPARMSITSGLNAIAHAAEALYAPDRSPIIGLMAEEGIRSLAASLPRIAADPADAGARGDALHGAWLCGACLGAVDMALHHKLCHVLGGMFDLPHAETHAILLPHAVAYNAPAAPAAMARIARALGVPDAAAGLFDLAGRLGAPRALRQIGFPDRAVDEVVRAVVDAPYRNPRPMEAGALRALLLRAAQGAPPES